MCRCRCYYRYFTPTHTTGTTHYNTVYLRLVLPHTAFPGSTHDLRAVYLRTLPHICLPHTPTFYSTIWDRLDGYRLRCCVHTTFVTLHILLVHTRYLGYVPRRYLFTLPPAVTVLTRHVTHRLFCAHIDLPAARYG